MTSIYEQRPWLERYPEGVPSEVEVPLKSVGQAFDETTEKWAGRTAAIFYGRKIRFKELREKVDRLARDLMVQEAIINDLKKKGFDLISALEGDDLLSDDPTRKLVRQVLGAIAEYDKTMTVLKLRAARMRKRQREGKCEGAKSLREVNPKLLNRIKLLRRPHKDGKRLKLHEIADRLNQEGYSTKRGKLFTGQNIANIMHRF